MLKREETHMNSNVVYFSPTGGTKAVAELIINDLGSQVFDMTVSVLPSFFNEDDIVFFLVPVYGGRIPKPVYERMKLMHGSNTPAVVITVYGNHTVGDALLEMKELAKECGFNVFAAGEMIAPHSLDKSYGAGRPDTSDKAKFKEFVDTVMAATSFKEVTVPGNKKYKPYVGVPVRPIVVRKNCMGCGICSETCPTNAVYLVQGRNSDVSKTELLKCISCMHCITVCASDARRVPIAEKAAIYAALAKSASSRKEPKFYL